MTLPSSSVFSGCGAQWFVALAPVRCDLHVLVLVVAVAGVVEARKVVVAPTPRRTAAGDRPGWAGQPFELAEVRALLIGYMLARMAESGRRAVRRYRCRRTDNHGRTIGCGQTFRIAEPVELLVKEAVLTAFDDPKIAITLAPEVDEDKMRALVQEYERRRSKVDQLVTDYATDLLTRKQFAQAKAIAEAAVQEAQELLAQAQEETALARVPAHPGSLGHHRPELAAECREAGGRAGHGGPRRPTGQQDLAGLPVRP
ncbi:hypothetical protein [Kitasatospora purpeofusca]|uniref:hypothetical protein n=1 Tax=Kitasatospora purpeofusca TaxID=67352 RepID=UPI0036B50D3E